jgi:hypothetical protein
LIETNKSLIQVTGAIGDTQKSLVIPHEMRWIGSVISMIHPSTSRTDENIRVDFLIFDQ